jgi:hypothetical protein
MYGYGYISIGGIGSGDSFDPDAQAFITAAGITDPTQQTAINTLVVSLKANGLWTKMKVIYPFVGGTATTHKFNLKDPRDLDAAFRLSFVGGWTHSSTGALPNGTNAYANSFFKPLTNGLAYNNNHIAYYSRTINAGLNSLSQFYEVGSGNNTGNNNLSLWTRREANTAGYDSSNFPTNRQTFSNTDGRGFYIGTAPNTTAKFFRNGVLRSSIVASAFSITDFNIYIGGFNEIGGSTYSSQKQVAFSSIGDGLTDTEAANFYTAVQTFQTTLGRNV